MSGKECTEAGQWIADLITGAGWEVTCTALIPLWQIAVVFAAILLGILKVIEFIWKWQDRRKQQTKEHIEDWSKKLDPREPDGAPSLDRLDRIAAQDLKATRRRKMFVVYKLVLRRLLRLLDRVFGAPTSDNAFGVSWSI